MRSTRSKWSTSRSRSYAWSRKRRGGSRWGISPFPFPFSSCPSWIRHCSSCLMVELAIHLQWTLTPFQSLQILFTFKKKPLWALPTFANDKIQVKICFQRGPCHLFFCLSVLFLGHVGIVKGHECPNTRHAAEACRTRYVNVSVSDTGHVAQN